VPAPATVLSSVVTRGDALAPAPGVSGTVGLIVTGGSDGDVKVWLRLEDGRPVEAGALDTSLAPDLTFTVAEPEPRSIVSGLLDPSVAFMRGRLKTTGDNGFLLGVLAATADPGFGAWLDGVAGEAGLGGRPAVASVVEGAVRSGGASAVDVGGPA
jgi:hypothetical protein